MKVFFVIATFCVFGINADMDLASEKIIECAKELKIDTRDIEKLEPPKKGCLLACMYKKVNKNGKSLYSSFAEAIKKSQYINFLGEPYDEDGKLHARLQKKLNKCYVRAGKDDCKFMTCLNIFKSPFLEFLTT